MQYAAKAFSARCIGLRNVLRRPSQHIASEGKTWDTE